jgi:hypothetical protein
VVCRGSGDPVEGGLSAGDFVEDLVGGFGPDEGLGLSFQQSIRVCAEAGRTQMHRLLLVIWFLHLEWREANWRRP